MKSYLPFLFLCFYSISFAQLTPGPLNQLIIDDAYSVDTMVVDFFSGNGCATISNISYTGVQSNDPNEVSNIGYFDGAGTDLGLSAGIVLSTGDIFKLNEVSNATSTFLNYPGDSDLDNALGGFPTFDAAVLEFDATALGNSISLSYVFGSEEFPEYIGTSFNDIFAFYVQGPNDPEPVNIAVLPDGNNTPVSINSVGNVAPYYIDNSNGQYLGLDGFTIPLSATFQTTPGDTYHIKIAIADVSDGVLDSSVFLDIESICGNAALKMPGDFTIEADANNDFIYNCTNNVRYAYEYFWDFGDGSTSLEKNPTHTYAQAGTYVVKLYTYNYCCEEVYEKTIQINSTSNELITKNSPIQLYPNPASESIYIETEGETYISISDITGKLIMEQIITENKSLDIEALNSGLYIFKATINGKDYIQKLRKI